MYSDNKLSPSIIASYCFAALALFLVLKVGLLVALFSGLLLYSLVRLLVPRIERRFSNQQSRMIAVVFLSVLIILTISLGIWGIVVFLRSDSGNLQSLLQRLAELLESSRQQLPLWASTYLPEDIEALKRILTTTLRDHASEAKLLGQEAGHLIVHLLLGMVIGSMVALQDVSSVHQYKPLAAALHQRIAYLADMFHRVVFAQVRISLINTLFTGIFLALILPVAGVHLPLVKSMIAITFIAGLIPVVGNIISNTVIVIVSLSHSLYVAAISLTYMVVIHKLEYFLNARIIGSQVNAKAWELLTAILVMEALFGLPGVVAAPVFYSYVKKELRECGLV
ncbi:AI-2E family transporter [Undibacterium macrobrachii]|jgi:predicted PurR-regulated permease PerM|uniref:Membrane protein n=1 Tax=Undibacterium macrobrachii TaxID=1119058 RepID=A0ABQ2XNQ2_9BURK|nr:AI-2E family transporter [Undibacterium macrobrachii]GGX25261.1 membrane protein [Undibacterium macrobrachii]